MNKAPDPYRQLDDRARTAVARLLDGMRHAVLAVNDSNGHPHLSRISCQVLDGRPTALISGISAHAAMLHKDPRAAIFIDETAPKGDPMNWARLSLQVEASLMRDNEDVPDHARESWVTRDPKASVYIRLPDFRFWQLKPVAGFLNAGFGAAYRLTPDDLAALSVAPIGAGPSAP